MKEQMNFPTSRESATPFGNEDRIDLRAASSGMKSYAALDRERQLEREQEAARESEPSPTLRELYKDNPPVIGVLLAGQRHDLSGEGLDE